MNTGKIVRKKSVLMSMGMGLLMGLVFTIINQLKQNGTLQPVGIIIGMVMSCIISAIIGAIINMKTRCDNILVKRLGLNPMIPSKKILYYLGEAIIGSVIFTPFNMFANQLYGMYMGMKMGNTFPPFAQTFGARINFIMSGPFWPAYGRSILPSIAIGVVIALVATGLLGKITDKMCGIDNLY